MAPVLRHYYTGLETIEIKKFEQKYSDIFSLKQLLITIREWLIAEEFISRSDDFELNESLYLQRNNPKGKTVRIRWRVRKELEPKNKLFFFHIDIEIACKNLQEVEFLHQGQKLKADKGDLELLVSAKIVTDQDNVLEEHKYLAKYKKFITGTHLRKQKEGHFVVIAMKAEELQTLIKEHLHLLESTVALRDFWPKRPPQ